MEKTLFAQIDEALARGESVALCTVIESHGSVPRHTGSKMLVFEDGSFSGSIGGGELESRVLKEAGRALADGKARKLSYSLTDPARGDPGLCGGQVEVFVEALFPPAKIVVIGGGHVGRAVTHLAKWLGFRVAVSDDRPEFCSPETNPEADEFYPVPMAELPAALKINRQTYLVLTTRGSAVDVAGLPSLLESPAAYIGVIGSKRRWQATLRRLQAGGLSAEKIARAHSPLGLEIQAETPEEIAVSILAEIIARRNGAKE
ncbi:MAG: XdhC/CoxI family protein [Anaerolineales bacterium]